MTWLDEARKACNQHWEEVVKNYIGEVFKEDIPQVNKKEEDTAMQVTYNGFTGKLLELKRKVSREFNAVEYKTLLYSEYDLSIYDSEKKVTHSFTGVNLEDVKFSGGEVSFK